MASPSRRRIDKGEHLLVQAGTGTGKSLGYLVPALRHAVLENEHVVVSTATLALQRQIITRDLPLVAKALAPHLPRPPAIALLKGWHNYVCVHKVAGGYPDDDTGTLFDLGDHAGAAAPARRAGRLSESLGEQVLRLREWADETDTGDRDDLCRASRPGLAAGVRHLAGVPGRKCPMLAECFPEKAKAASGRPTSSSPTTPCWASPPRARPACCPSTR